MKKWVKVLLPVIAGVLIVAAAAVALLYWRIGPFWLDRASLIPAAWRHSTDWNAEVTPGRREEILLRACRIGEDGREWLAAVRGRADGDILTLEEAVLTPEAFPALVRWLTRHMLPVRLIVITGADLEGAYTLTGDRNAGHWLRLRSGDGAGRSERVTLDVAGENGQYTGAELPKRFHRYRELLELVPAAVSGDYTVRWSRPWESAEPTSVEIVRGNAELTWRPDGWRLTLRDIAWPAPVNLRFHRLTFTGHDGEPLIRVSGEAAGMTEPGMKALWPDATVDNAAFAGERQNGAWRWELQGAAPAKAWRADGWQGMLSRWSVRYAPDEPLAAEGEITDVQWQSEALRCDIPLLRFRTVWQDGGWQGEWQAERGRIPALAPGWSDGEVEALSGNFPMTLPAWRMQALRLKWRQAFPEWSVIADKVEWTPEGMTAELAALAGLEWQSLWRQPEWRPGAPFRAARMELKIPVRGFEAVVEKPEVTIAKEADGVAAALSAAGWSFTSSVFAAASTSPERRELARGTIAEGRWRGIVTLEGMTGAVTSEGQLSYREAALRLPLEFPDAGLRPAATAKANEATGLYREVAALAPGEMRVADMRLLQLTLGALQAEWKPLPVGWQVTGKLVLQELAGSELYFAWEKGRWEWLLPAAEWNGTQLPHYFPAWKNIAITGLVGLHGKEGVVTLECRSAGIGGAGLKLEGVKGDLALTTPMVPVTAQPAMLEFQSFGSWGAGELQLEWLPDELWRFAALRAAWCGGTVELTTPVEWRPARDEVVIYPVRVTGARLDAVLRRFGIKEAEQPITLAGDGEWHWLREGGWSFGGMALTGSADGVRLQLPGVAERVAGTNHSAEFFRQFLRDFECRSLRLTWVAGESGAGTVLKLGVRAKPSAPLAFVFSGDAADPLAPARPGEPPFQSEIDFEISLQIP